MTHHIQQQYLHIDLNGTEADGLALQRRLSQLCYDSLLPALERVLDQYAPSNGHLLIDRLEIDAGVLTLDQIDTHLAKVITEGLERAFREQIVSTDQAGISENVVRMTEQQSVENALLYFLETGRLPWSFQLPAGQDLEQAVLAYWHEAPDSITDFRWVNQAIRQLLKSPNARKRLLAQFSPAFWQVVVARLWPVGKDRIDAIRSHLQEVEAELADGPFPALTALFEQRMREIVLAHLASGTTPTETELVSEVWRSLPEPMRQQPTLVSKLTYHWPGLKDAFTTLSIRTDRSNDQSKSAADEPLKNRPHQIADEPTENGIYIDQAGLVLLHPFLPRFFEAVAVAQPNQLIDTDRALALLHYLATGQRTAPEYALPLAKVLCNVPLSTPTKRDVALNEAETDEADALLRAVIRHWEALRNTSPDGLRGTFLTRPGKLSLRADKDWLLQVEASSYDILLSQLPWSVSMIKLPWMARMLWVEWG